MKKNFKNSLIITASIIMLISLLSGCGIKVMEKEKTIGNLVDYFKNSGLKVENEKEMTKEEKETVESAKNALKSMGVGDKSNVVEKEAYMIETARVEILRYKDDESAKTAYDYYLGFEEREKERSEKQRSPYFKSTHFLNGSLLMHIRYYKVKLVAGGIGPEKLEVNEDDANKIQKTFEEFK
jgi:hypothetical protein